MRWPTTFTPTIADALNNAVASGDPSSGVNFHSAAVQDTVLRVHCNHSALSLLILCCMSAIKSRVVDAAIDLVGTKGLRALTHARVDERAGLPKGSTSNYFRSHQALLSGVVDGIVDRELPSVGVAFSPSSPDELISALCALFEYLTTVNRTVTTARLVLFMEASHNAALREALSRGRAAMEALGVVALARLGAREPHTAGVAIAACFEGLLLHRIARHDPTDPRPTFELVVRAALA
jgi:DNA-binding transcriptional regulator YbjK